jgi:ribosomal-protein-alanine N-acetyltransferase
MTTITLRDYRPGDWKAMYALDLQCFAPPFRFTRRVMHRFAETRGAITLLAHAEGLLAGFCIAHIEVNVGYVVTLDVAPEHRRNGLARRLMREIEIRAQAAGAGSMALHVFPGNTAALQLYQALGYEQAEVAANFYGSSLDALVYRKPLASPEGVPR